jgi:hypothetical protein
MTPHPPPSPYPESRVLDRPTFIPSVVAWSTLAIMLGVALVEVLVAHPHMRLREDLTSIGILALASVALLLAVRRVRGRTRIADAFFPLVLLNPLLYSYQAHSDVLDRRLLATGVLGLVTGAIVAMKRDNVLRYFAIAALTLALTTLSRDFLMVIPALMAWFLYTGYSLARDPIPMERTRGFMIMAIGEASLLLFGVACILEKATPPPPPSTLFSSIVSFGNFPLIVLAIMMLALGWRKGPHATTPPHFAGMLALLVGLLTLLLNNFQGGALPRPGEDQTVVVLCLLYIVFALHGPRRLQWVMPPALMLAAGAHAWVSWMARG